MGLGVMTQMPREAPDIRCVFCKTELETDVRCAWCKKLLAQRLSTPYSIKCPRCKMMRDTVGPCPSIGLNHRGTVEGRRQCKKEFR